MQSGLILSQADIHVSEDKVIASKYSFIVVQEPDKPTPKESD